MSLLLRRHVDQYRIDIAAGLPLGHRPHDLGSSRLEPLADQLAVKTIMFNDQHALHGQLRA
jgi:hypothetical protein